MLFGGRTSSLKSAWPSVQTEVWPQIRRLMIKMLTRLLDEVVGDIKQQTRHRLEHQWYQLHARADELDARAHTAAHVRQSEVLLAEAKALREAAEMFRAEHQSLQADCNSIKELAVGEVSRILDDAQLVLHDDNTIGLRTTSTPPQNDRT